ncbi:type II toxin-antitoxin system RelE/ParE family toxin [Neptunomonas phycophila]|uniref:type II toxin-antitoxin system RelE/ParE family toxin n=1 Tax=Neptunomonas phycophila TaxID=1572645 RepID=UPI000948F0E6|nr:type II toxin-antitoxin system RelE/ParE family toxin [Neptunomonas phycophila]
MSAFTLTQRAKSDLKAIAKFTENHWGRAHRNIYIKQFDEAFHMLAGSPSMGKNCDFIKFGYHKFPQGSHIIFYKVVPNRTIEIIRILHKNMDVASRLSDS